MGIQIETPGRGTGSLNQQLQQLRSYLHRTAQQLQWAFDTLEAGAKTQSPGAEMTSGKEAPDPQQSFSQLKGLIIKSADIVNAYSDIIEKKLEGVYTAQSEFGTFREQTSQRLHMDSERVEQLFSSHQQLSQALEDLSAQTSASSAYIRTGCLQKGETPIYGLEIGQKNTVDGVETFDKFARFTADRLSFFDRSDVEVAYISDYKLYITNAQVTGSLVLGSRFVLGFDGGLCFRWTGGES